MRIYTHKIQELNEALKKSAKDRLNSKNKQVNKSNNKIKKPKKIDYGKITLSELLFEFTNELNKELKFNRVSITQVIALTNLKSRTTSRALSNNTYGISIKKKLIIVLVLSQYMHIKGYILSEKLCNMEEHLLKSMYILDLSFDDILDMFGQFITSKSATVIKNNEVEVKPVDILEKEIFKNNDILKYDENDLAEDETLVGNNEHVFIPKKNPSQKDIKDVVSYFTEEKIESLNESFTIDETTKPEIVEFTKEDIIGRIIKTDNIYSNISIIDIEGIRYVLRMKDLKIIDFDGRLRGTKYDEFVYFEPDEIKKQKPVISKNKYAKSKKKGCI